MSKPQQTFVAIMLFYIFLSYFLMPAIFFFFIEKTLKSAGKGFVLGSFASIVMWIGYGANMV